MSCISWRACVFYRDVEDVINIAVFNFATRAHRADGAGAGRVEGDGEDEEAAGEQAGAGERVEEGECDDGEGEGGAVGGEGVAGPGGTGARVKYEKQTSSRRDAYSNKMQRRSSVRGRLLYRARVGEKWRR